MTAHALMIQGTGSDVGKSLLVAGLCRAAIHRGYKVHPFKPQNMSNNAAVTDDGGEIGRAQWLQALACGVPPSVHMNPVLLKPESDGVSQMVVQGQRMGRLHASDYRSRKTALMQAVQDSFARVCQGVDLVIVEGAGSPAEINLRAGDLANMGFALPNNVPVVLAADIDRGGVIAALVGTHAVLNDDDRGMVAGFIINKFRGDISLFTEGVHMINERTGWRYFGTLPYISSMAHLPKEDGFSLRPQSSMLTDGTIRISVLRFPHLANYDDFDPLQAESGVSLTFVEEGQPVPASDVIILPGTKSTLADLDFLRAQGWHIDILAHARAGRRVLGVCGGYQMLGTALHDPDGLDGMPGSCPGLALLEVETIFRPHKQLEHWQGHCTESGAKVTGYHMHMGQTQGVDCARPMFTPTEGAQTQDGVVRGCYVHGLFSEDAFRHHFLNSLRAREISALRYTRRVEALLDELADDMEKYLDIEGLLTLARPMQVQPQAQAI